MQFIVVELRTLAASLHPISLFMSQECTLDEIWAHYGILFRYIVSLFLLQGLLPFLLEFQIALLLGIHIILRSQLAALHNKTIFS